MWSNVRLVFSSSDAPRFFITLAVRNLSSVRIPAIFSVNTVMRAEIEWCFHAVFQSGRAARRETFPVSPLVFCAMTIGRGNRSSRVAICSGESVEHFRFEKGRAQLC
jgi:hypothetical protein